MKMNCAEAKYLMPLYESGELDAATMAAFDLHLRQCLSCAAHLEECIANDALLREAITEQRIDAAPLLRRIREKISAPKPRRISFLRQPRLAGAFIALILLLSSGTFVYLLFVRSAENVYASAVEDHFHEVVERAPVRGWRETPDEIEKLIARELGDAAPFEKLQFSSLRLTKARICMLSGKRYVHLLYASDSREVSVFIRRKDGEQLPGKIQAEASGCDLHSMSKGNFQVAGFQSAAFTVLLVGELSQTESLRLAREAAERLA
jgi:anti-sigma factor RsiW